MEKHNGRERAGVVERSAPAKSSIWQWIRGAGFIGGEDPPPDLQVPGSCCNVLPAILPKHFRCRRTIVRIGRRFPHEMLCYKNRWFSVG